MTPGQVLVVIYNGSLGGIGFGVGAGGFGIDSNASGSLCMDGGVISAMAGTQSQPGPFQPDGAVRAPVASLVGLAALSVLLAAAGIRRLRLLRR